MPLSWPTQSRIAMTAQMPVLAKRYEWVANSLSGEADGEGVMQGPAGKKVSRRE